MLPSSLPSASSGTSKAIVWPANVTGTAATTSKVSASVTRTTPIRTVGLEQVEEVLDADVLRRQAEHVGRRDAGGRILIDVEEDVPDHLVHRRAWAEVDRHRDDRAAVGAGPDRRRRRPTHRRRRSGR